MGKAVLSDNDFASLTKQANLALRDDEKKQIKDQLDEALSATHVLNELETSGVPELNHPTGDMYNVWREDVVQPSLNESLVLSGAHKSHKGYFVVKAVFNEET